MECFRTTDFDNNSRLITLTAIVISGLHCIMVGATGRHIWYSCGKYELLFVKITGVMKIVHVRNWQMVWILLNGHPWWLLQCSAQHIRERCKLSMSTTDFVKLTGLQAILMIAIGTIRSMGHDSSVGTAPHYGLDSPRIILVGARFSAPVQTSSRLTRPPIQRVPGPFPMGKVAGVWCWTPTPL
jgi:hypothetical protein